MSTGSALISCMMAVTPILATSPGPGQPVAIVCSVQGTVQANRPQGNKRILVVRDWLTEGCQIEVPAAANLVLVFGNGNRFAITGPFRGRIAAQGPNALQGAVRKVDTVPMIPTLGQTRLRQAGGTPGAIIVRTPSNGTDPVPVTCLPLDDGQVLADQAILCLRGKGGPVDFRADIFDAAGTHVFSSSSEQGRIRIPVGVLQPGQCYRWEARLAASHVYGVITHHFCTVNAEHAQTRRHLLERFRTNQDPELGVLLEAMDQWLGLDED